MFAKATMEQTTFRSRSFRRSIFAACSLFLFVINLHNVNLQHSFQKRIVDPYRSQVSPGKRTTSWLSRSAQVHHSQATFQDDEEVLDETPQFSHEPVTELPSVIRIPFEEAVSDVSLQGWEDEWLTSAIYDSAKHGSLAEPKLDFVYNWVNGSDPAFNEIKHKFELLSPLNDAEGKWISKHSVNRYRDWDELRYSFRSLDRYARGFLNSIQLLVNSVQNSTDPTNKDLRPQRPDWLADNANSRNDVQILAQEDFFAEEYQQCAPSFDSVSIESQIHMTPSNVDQFVALSDDMFLGAPHSAADFYSPLFGSVMGFKSDHYNIKELKKSSVPTFGEKPYLHYTSWLLNHRFGQRDRKAQAHFTHSVSRRVMKEAMASFPRPAARGPCERFRGESKFQIYPWYAAFHYSIERFREALLWSFIMTRADANGDGYLDWSERQNLLEQVNRGQDLVGGGDAWTPAATNVGRDRMYYQLPAIHQSAGLEPPVSNINVVWTSLDGPETIRNLKCHDFYVDKCFAESFDSPISDASYTNPDFTSSNILSQLSHREPKCGDCMLKFLLSGTKRGLAPLLPPKSMHRERDVVIKALTKYQHTVIEPDAMFVMIKDAEQAENELLERVIKRNKQVGQWCLNDDVMTDDAKSVSEVNNVIQTVFKTLFPAKSRWEVDSNASAHAKAHLHFASVHSP